MSARLSADKGEVVIHADVWTDPWERHWLGAIAERLAEDGFRESFLVAFEDLDSWADPLEDVSAHQAQTAATALRSSFSTDLKLGSLPAWP